MSLLKMFMGAGGGYIPPDSGGIPETTAIILVIMGQSNAAGNIGGDAFLPTDWQIAQSNIKIANKGNSGSPQALQFVSMDPGVNSSDIFNNSPVGIEQVLMHTIQLYYKRTVYLLKIAYGGYSIDDFISNGNNNYGAIGEQAIPDAEAWLMNNGYTDILCLGFVWIQGETEALNNVSTATYAAKERTVFANFRAKADWLQNAPIYSQLLSAELQTRYDPPKLAAINNAKVQNAGLIANYRTIDPDLTNPLPEMQPGESDFHYSQIGHNQNAGRLIDEGLIPDSQILTSEYGYALTTEDNEILEYE